MLDEAGYQGADRGGVNLFVAGERIRPNDPEPAATIEDSEVAPAGFRVLRLEPLVRMKLTAHRLRDQMHLIDLIRVGLIDASWPPRFIPELAARLQVLIDDPDG